MLNAIIFPVFKLYVLNMVTPDDRAILWLKGLSSFYRGDTTTLNLTLISK